MLILIAIFAFTGCKSENKLSHDLKTVILPDYKSIKINACDIDVSRADLDAAIRMDLYLKEVTLKRNVSEPVADGDLVNADITADGSELGNIELCIGDDEICEGFDNCLIGCHVGDTVKFETDGKNYIAAIKSAAFYAEEMTDELAKKYYNVPTAEEAVEKIRQVIIENRKWEAAYDFIIQNTVISGTPTGLRSYMKERTDVQKTNAAAFNISFEEYLRQYYNQTEEEFIKGIEGFYYEMLTVIALGRDAGFEYTSDSRYETLASAAKGEGISLDEAEKSFDDMYIQYLFYLSCLRPYIVDLLEIV